MIKSLKWTGFVRRFRHYICCKIITVVEEDEVEQKKGGSRMEMGLKAEKIV